MVRSRQRPTISSWSKAPMVTFELPTSSASSILSRSHPARQDGDLRPIIFAHSQESSRVEPASDALDSCLHAHAFAYGVAGGAGETADDCIVGKRAASVHRFDQRHQQVFARDLDAFEPQ